MINNNMQPMDPNAYLQQYASKNNLDVETAKVKLQELYGDPTQDGANAPQDTFVSSTKTDENSLVSAEIAADFEDDSNVTAGAQKEQTEESKSVDKEAVVSALASEAGITTNEAKEALEALGIEDGSEKVDPANKLADFVEATGLTEDAAKAFLQKYVGEPKQN